MQPPARICYGAIEIVEYIHKMAELCKQASAVLSSFSAPVAACIVSVSAVPEAVYLYQVNLTKLIFCHKLFYFLYRRVVPVLLHCKNSFPGLPGGGYHAVAFSQACCHWLFHHRVHACL